MGGNRGVVVGRGVWVGGKRELGRAVIGGLGWAVLGELGWAVIGC